MEVSVVPPRGLMCNAHRTHINVDECMTAARGGVDGTGASCGRKERPVEVASDEHGGRQCRTGYNLRRRVVSRSI